MFFKKKLKIGIVGGCQSEGLREATIALIPRSEVTCWHAGVHPDSPEEIAEKLKAFDVVISQVTPNHGLEVLEIDRLREKLTSVHFMPTAVFSGFHPDMTYIFDEAGLISAVHSDFHSKIAVAGFLLDLTPSQTKRLYNALVFAELGYFADFDAARLVFEQSLSDGGLNGTGLVDRLLREVGPFMFMANHPSVKVLTLMCHDLYQRLGLIKAKAPIPFVAKDHLAESFTWPIYPDLAHRAGVVGSLYFQRPAWLTPQGTPREFSLDQYITDLHVYYASIERKRLATHSILQVCDQISTLLN